MSKFLVIAGFLGFAGVALGAFGAHGLEDKLVSTGHIDTWKTATDYLFVHVLALLAVTVMALDGESMLTIWSRWLWVAGILIFSGSLYTLALTGISKLGMITPFGGLCLLGGWVCVILLGLKGSKQSLEKS